MSALEAEFHVEVDPEVGEVDDPRLRLFGEDAYSRLAAEPAPGAQRVLRVQLGRVVRAGGGGNAALREPTRACEDRPFREDEDARFGARAQGSGKPCNPAADNDQVVFAFHFR